MRISCFADGKLSLFVDDEKLSFNEKHLSFVEHHLKEKRGEDFPQQKLAVEKQSEIDKLLPALFSPF